MRYSIFAILILGSSMLQAQLPASTTMAEQSANNTSASATFMGEPNGNSGPGNVSKLPVRTLLYPGATTKIYAHLLPWWGSGSHANIGYSSQDPAQVHRQVQDMVSRGLDGVVVDWYGPGSYEETGVKLVLAEAEATPGFGVILDIDVGAINWHSCYPTCSATTAVMNLLTNVSTKFYSSPALVRWNGRPVITEFGFETLTLPAGAASGWNVVDWNAVQAQAPGNPAIVHRNVGGFSKPQSAGSFNWMSPRTLSNYTAGFDGTVDLDWFYTNAVSKYPTMTAFGAVWKGFDDTIASWSPTGGRHIDQNCGQTWLNTFAKINQYYSASQQLPDMQLVTWNDYEEGTELETGIDNCVRLTASVNGAQLAWTATGNENAVDHYTVYASQDGVHLASLGDFDVSTHSVDLSTFTLPAGDYTMYVQAVGKPSIRNQMSAAAGYTVAPAPPTTPPPTTPPPTTNPVQPPAPPVVQKDVTISAAPAAQAVKPGQSATYTLTVSQTGATDPVQLSCSGLTAGLTCSFSASTITPGSSGTQVRLTINASTQLAQNQPGATAFATFLFSGVGLLGIGAAGRRRKLAAIALFAIVLLAQIGCGGAAMQLTTTTPAKTPQATQSATYTITVNAVSGTVTKSTVVSLTVG